VLREEVHMKKILVVDDEPNALKMLTLTLKI